ncbi:MAG: hypothetical protein EAZ53_01930 [Bacteroidetes bacterium]|nr:MAG: hypothetical protein EAZ53_01930 [Bacteroidota bacterium]
MKNTIQYNKFFKLLFVGLLCSCFWALAQSPNRFSYQAVVRNAAGVLLPNASVGVRISLLQGSANGTVVFSETHTPTTNANGLISIFVGGGTPISGNIATINWGNGTYFLKSELDIAGGSNYTLSQTDQILSVAYALHSASTSSVDWTNVQNKPNFGTSTFSGSYLDLTNKPTIPASFSGSYLDLTNRPVIINNTFTGSYNDLTNKPIIPASFSGSYLDLTNKPVIINNTFTGSYTDLTNKPTIPASFSGSYLDLTNKPTIINNTFTGSYTDLTNKPTIPASFSGSSQFLPLSLVLI